MATMHVNDIHSYEFMGVPLQYFALQGGAPVKGFSVIINFFLIFFINTKYINKAAM